MATLSAFLRNVASACYKLLLFLARQVVAELITRLRFAFYATLCAVVLLSLLVIVVFFPDLARDLIQIGMLIYVIYAVFAVIVGKRPWPLSLGTAKTKTKKLK